MKTKSGVKTNPSVTKTAKGHNALDNWGNQGNTTGTTLPKGGCPVGTKKTKAGKRAYA